MTRSSGEESPMRYLRKLPIVAMVTLVLVGCAAPTDESVDDAQLGLSKTSVFSTPDPIVATSTAGEPGENVTSDAYFSESPPLIPHQVEEYLPIRIGENLCLDCHDLPDQIGEPVAGGDPTPAPASHYTDLRRSPGEVTDTIIGARFSCMQCHAPQADAEPLVANTYRQ